MKNLLLILFVFSVATSEAQYFRPAETLMDKNLLKDYFLLHMALADSDLQQIKNKKVTLRFSVDEFGQPGNFEIIKGISPEADQEAIRLVKNLLWQPATRNGNPTVDQQEIEVPFHYKHLQRLQKKGFAKAPEIKEFPKCISQNIHSFATLEKAPEPILTDDMTLNQFIIANLNYPEEAYNRNISGTVSMDFIIEKNGLASNIVITESVGGGCDQEAIRLLQSIQWFPGMVQDSLVRSKNHLDILFTLGDKRMQNIPNRQGTNL